MTKKIIAQLIKEFWAPLVISLAWTFISYQPKPGESWSISGLTQSAFITFFGISFFFAQWNRVKNKLKVEDGLTGIEGKIGEMLKNLEEKTYHLVGHITGGDGYCFVEQNDSFSVLIVRSPFTLYEVTAQVIDLRLMAKNATIDDPRMRYSGETVQLGTLLSGTFIPWVRPLNFDGNDTQYFNINFMARNGPFYQQLRFRRVDGRWLRASRVMRINPEVILQEFVDPQYPLTADGKVNWNYYEN